MRLAAAEWIIEGKAVEVVVASYCVWYTWLLG